ncbi:granzyme B-like isoform X1 [Cyprinus carpio]|uniref:Granzyme B-like isoform X1 n=1 Tax=Cyprinus carpio TaxID=7962 RepID=A0A9Q9VMK6_CYPCA|nr:granzyme B-like isoform X1 [Cyprinus carpio]
MMTIISLLLLASLLPHLTFTAHVNVGIVNGKEAKPHSRPYMVSLQINGHHNCCGFLVSDEFVLTAAHCQKKNEILTAVVGAHDLKKMTEGSVRIRVKSYHQHPDYNRDTNLNDIMLLRLQEKVKLSQNVEPISLMNNKKDIKPGTACSVAGWGKLKFKGSASDRLMEANMKIMKNTQCKNKWKGRKYSVSKMMCVFGCGGSCKGDSGGPLICGDTAVGVTSFGDANVCNSPEHPNVYTKISAYLKWIRKIIIIKKNVK